MKRLILLSILLISGIAHAEYKLPEQWQKMVTNRRICVKREVVDGKVITYWERNGKPDWIKPSVETNELKRIRGKQMNNALQNRITELQKSIDAAHEKIQGEIDNLNEEIAQYEEYKTKYPLLIGIWNLKISNAETRIKVLEALTNGGTLQ